MYYKKLEHIYRSQDIKSLFPKITIEKIDLFIRKTDAFSTFISPYKFAMENGITINESVKLFMYLTYEDDGLFDTIFYFECSRSSCHSSRIYFSNIDEDVLHCDECGKRYSLQTIRPYIKVLFKLKDDIDIPNEILTKKKSDPNSTYQALEGLPDHLKPESPSSLTEFSQAHDEGDDSEGVDIDLVFKENINKKGNPISPLVERFKKKVMEIQTSHVK
ncbi:hypothetical protein [Bacillus solitudinis]|uniref:hypothetical protein n=1 Tax=Bacillus solitudinis TaxID=2014074 RepID=UPI000C236C98|nr:hypothetical protein [Bacillus solitudinis]